MGMWCRKRGIPPAPGIWDYDGTESEGDSISFGVFQWRNTPGVDGIMKSRAYRRFSGRRERELLLQGNADCLCEELQFLSDITRCSDPILRRELAGDPGISSDLLDRMSADEDTQVRLNVAMNRNTDPQTLRRMSRDPDPEVRAKVARSLNTPDDVLAELAADDIGVVQTAVRQSIAFRESRTAHR